MFATFITHEGETSVRSPFSLWLISRTSLRSFENKPQQKGTRDECWVAAGAWFLAYAFNLIDKERTNKVRGFKACSENPREATFNSTISGSFCVICFA